MNNDKIILACFIIVAVIMIMAIFALPLFSTITAKLVLSGIILFCSFDYMGIV
jgi:hypothetical protein